MGTNLEFTKVGPKNPMLVLSSLTPQLKSIEIEPKDLVPVPGSLALEPKSIKARLQSIKAECKTSIPMSRSPTLKLKFPMLEPWSFKARLEPNSSP